MITNFKLFENRIEIGVEKNRHGDFDLDIPSGSMTYDDFTDLYTDFSNGESYGVSYGENKATLSVTEKGLEEMIKKSEFQFTGTDFEIFMRNKKAKDFNL